MTKRDKIIESALTWVDTPYHHHARIKGVGVDCAHLVAGVAIESGLATEEEATKIPNYPVQWHLHNREEHLLNILESFKCKKVDKSTTKPGDILTFQFGRTSSHLGIMLNDNMFIHADLTIGKVVLVSFNDAWIERWTNTYKFPGVR